MGALREGPLLRLILYIYEVLHLKKSKYCITILDNILFLKPVLDQRDNNRDRSLKVYSFYPWVHR